MNTNETFKALGQALANAEVGDKAAHEVLYALSGDMYKTPSRANAALSLGKQAYFKRRDRLEELLSKDAA